MNQNNQHLEDIKAIKRMMEESTRYLSISGSAGILMGLIAIAGAIAATMIIPDEMINGKGYTESIASHPDGVRIIKLLLVDAALVLLLATSAAFFFSVRKARRHGQKLWSTAAKRLMLNLAVPLAVGGVVTLLTLNSVPGYVSASLTLVFYGLALINASKYTFTQIYWLGIAEIVTGVATLLVPGQSIWFWGFGFGALHIAYGSFMYLKYRE
ncbi:MAG: hypothetical protein IH591_16015 [Bacteroidales bacterium]|nr:hypothetical protein [Bacteroidales bacterium]